MKSELDQAIEAEVRMTREFYNRICKAEVR
jgi:hypothetical protein